MPAGTTALDLVEGITEWAFIRFERRCVRYSSRIALKMLFTQFGEAGVELDII